MDNLKHTNFFRALTASAGVPSSFTAITKTTSTLPPPPHPLQQSTVHRDIFGDPIITEAATFVSGGRISNTIAAGVLGIA
ncbi:hypothetical protein Tco_1072086 [Tanacetum coccineum]